MKLIKNNKASEMLIEYNNISTQIKQLEQKRKELKDNILNAFGTDFYVLIEENNSVNTISENNKNSKIIKLYVSHVKSRYLDTKNIKLRCPDLYELYQTKLVESDIINAVVINKKNSKKIVKNSKKKNE